ncbi:MAG: hypothetical protein ACI4L7_01240 [Christensenellales bacterium]
MPFISAGSTSLVVFMSVIGILLNIDRQSRNNEISLPSQTKFTLKWLKKRHSHKEVRG